MPTTLIFTCLTFNNSIFSISFTLNCVLFVIYDLFCKFVVLFSSSLFILRFCMNFMQKKRAVNQKNAFKNSELSDKHHQYKKIQILSLKRRADEMWYIWRPFGNQCAAQTRGLSDLCPFILLFAFIVNLLLFFILFILLA